MVGIYATSRQTPNGVTMTDTKTATTSSPADIEDLKTRLSALALTSPTEAGIKTTEMLSAEGCADVEQYSGVSLVTINHKDGTQHVYIIHGVFFVELQKVEATEVADAGKPYWKPDQNFSFCLMSSDEFVADVCVKGNGIFHWPRTDSFYRIPPWYHNKIAEGVLAMRARS